ncbi:flavin monoamine oxidase family protein [Rhodococcus sp. NPDC056960]|uniref:flavin monoamine oxidase family protein n=1 Tax=Rhodococcus sp. NPDC056960 TaxID=3345982 RepID=UPI0036381D2E
MDEVFDVVVVGAGFAGITAARDLTAEGKSVLVLEGRDRIGGRTYTDDAIGRPVELGGTYVHWTQPHLWREMQRHGLALATPLPIERVHFLSEGTLHSRTEAEAEALATAGMEQLVADAREHFPDPYDIYATDIGDIDLETFADRMKRLDVSPLERDLIDGVLSYTVVDPDQQAVSQLLVWTALNFGNVHALWESGALWRIATGTKSLIEAMADESTADIRLSTPVSAIEDEGSEVLVTTRSGDKIRAKAAIVTVPVNALNTIEFTPSLREPSQRLIDEGHPMRNRKMWVRVKGEIESFIAYAPLGENPITFAVAEYRVDGDTLIVCFCPDSAAIDSNDKDAVQKALRTFVPDIEVVETACHDWVDDEYSQGTWMMMRPGQLTSAIPDIQKPHGRIHFASGDIAPAFAGWIEGALQSGALTARSVSQAIAPGAPLA